MNWPANRARATLVSSFVRRRTSTGVTRLTDSNPQSEQDIEGLLAALSGVLAARVSVSDAGRVEEVHILADASLHPKQVVRNIESALSAGFGLAVDRRLISVAQVRAEDAGMYDEVRDAPAEPPVAAVQVEEPPGARYVFVGYDARTQPDLEAACRVTIRRGNHVYSGSGAGPSTTAGRAQAAARAVFAALATARVDQALELDGATPIECNGRSYVLVAAHARAGRHVRPLTGMALLHRAPEEASILASLQAVNRWAEIDG